MSTSAQGAAGAPSNQEALPSRSGAGGAGGAGGNSGTGENSRAGENSGAGGNSGASGAPTPPPRSKRPWSDQAQHGAILFVLVASFIIVGFWNTLFVAKRAGEQGVYWSRFFGGTSNVLLGEGTHAKFPWDEIYIYSLRTQEISDKTVLLTRDGMELNVEWSVRFRPAPEFLPDIHRRVGPEYAKRLILPEVTGSLREIIGNHTAEEIYAGDENILIRDISRRTRTKLDPYHIVLDSLLILRLDLPPEMAKSIVEKLVNEQAMLAYRFRLRGEEEEKRRKEIEAQGIRTFEDISKVSILKWKGIEATRELARSNNAKIILMGAGTNSMPVLLNADTPAGGEASAPAAPAAPRAVK